MPLSSEEIIDEMIVRVVARVATLNAALPSGVELPLTETGNEHDPEGRRRYKNIKYGVRGSAPGGFALQFFPLPRDLSWFYAPNGRKSEHRIQIILSFKEPSKPNGPNLNPDVIARTFDAATEALDRIIGSRGLNDGGGGWDVKRDGRLLLDPVIRTVRSMAWITEPNVTRKQVIPYADLLFTGFEIYEV